MNPYMAAIIAFLVTTAYIYAKNLMNNDDANYFKPATLTAILVFAITYYGEKY
jgi:hypothetical protein